MRPSTTGDYVARQLLKPNRTTATCEAVRAAWKAMGTAIDAGIDSHLEKYLARLEELYEDRGMRAMYKHLKSTVGLRGQPSGGH